VRCPRLEGPSSLKGAGHTSDVEIVSFELRPATARDAASIRRLIRQVHINPMDLDWRRFTVAVDDAGNLVGCGQLKPHRGSVVELASIGVVPEFRHLGIARAIIEKLIGRADRPLFLMCRASLEPFYDKWGFVSLEPVEMPSYFRRLWRLAALAARFRMTPDRLSVMALM
jgi:N-acetylglutamate synthase-like GNAT family acetyltransferase